MPSLDSLPESSEVSSVLRGTVRSLLGIHDGPHIPGFLHYFLPARVVSLPLA